jgi:CsoR family transcriptional regulator, copper-sensing transcriptional repressor
METDKKILTNLKKAQSLLGKVAKMVEDGDYCIDVMQQTLAAIGMLKSVNNDLMNRHLGSCFSAAMKGSNKKRAQDMIDEVIRINKMTNK